MGLTVNNAAQELRKKEFASVSEAADCVASGLLRGARGNSGVITSLLFRGLSKRLKGVTQAGAREFANAMGELHFEIDPEKCLSCGSCAAQCPAEAIHEA